MPRSFLSQALQIAASATYDDAVSSPHTGGVAEGQASIEGDLNVLRTLVKNLVGEATWYTAPQMTVKNIADKYFIEFLHQSGFDDVASGTGGSSTAFDTAIKTIASHANGAGSSTAGGVLLNVTKAYRVAIRNHATQDSINDGSGNEVYGRLSYGAGVYTLTWYSTISGVETAYSFVSSVNLDVAFVGVSRRYEDLDWGIFLDPSFHDSSGISGTVDDSNVTTGPWTLLLSGDTTAEQAFTKLDKLGSTANGEGASGIKIEDASTWFTGTDLEAALNELETLLGSATSATFNFAEDNVLADNDPIYPALDKLDKKWGDLASAVTNEGASLVGIEDAGAYTAETDVEGALQELYQKVQSVAGWNKQSETLASPIGSGSNHTLPGGMTYTLASGANLDVYFQGQLMLEGVSDDYQEISTTQVSPNFTVPSGKNLTYMARK